MPNPITASMLYDLVACPHRVLQDLFGNLSQRDPVNPFIQLLWEKGTLYEKEVIANLRIPFLDLSGLDDEERERQTAEAMKRKEPLIYSGRIRADDLLGNPDLLRLEGTGYAPIDIKSGAGEEGPEDLKKPKKHYAVQLALYVDILERKGLSGGRKGYIWDIHGEEVAYDLSAPPGPRMRKTLWEEYIECLELAREIVSRAESTLPAYGSVCKLCHWQTDCLSNLEAKQDITLIFELGRSRREALGGKFATIPDLANSDLSPFISGKKTAFPGIGPDSLRKFQRRAQLLTASNGKAYAKGTIGFPPSEREVFFDIEDDPFRGLCYLHGFVVRMNGDNATEKYVAFFTEKPTPEEEERIFSQAWKFLADCKPCAVYFYSKYERTTWKRLREKYPHVCSEGDLEALFVPPAGIDLYYDVVFPSTEWPTRDYSIKTLASYLGFSWRDPHPSGAASIEWFHRWVETGDVALKQRILDYNEDDCRATRVLLDGIKALPIIPH